MTASPKPLTPEGIAATPATELEQQITDSRIPKNEREWWAHREIARLRERLADLERERDEALQVAEGPSTLRELAAGCVARGMRLAECEAEIKRKDEALKAALILNHDEVVGDPGHCPLCRTLRAAIAATPRSPSMSDTREELLRVVTNTIAGTKLKQLNVLIAVSALRDLAAFLSTPTPEEVATVIKALETEYRTMSRSAEAAAVMLSRLSLAAQEADQLARDGVDKARAWDMLAKANDRIAHLEAEIARKDERLAEVERQLAEADAVIVGSRMLMGQHERIRNEARERHTARTKESKP